MRYNHPTAWLTTHYYLTFISNDHLLLSRVPKKYQGSKQRGCLLCDGVLQRVNQFDTTILTIPITKRLIRTGLQATNNLSKMETNSWPWPDGISELVV